MLHFASAYLALLLNAFMQLEQVASVVMPTPERHFAWVTAILAECNLQEGQARVTGGSIGLAASSRPPPGQRLYIE